MPDPHLDDHYADDQRYYSRHGVTDPYSPQQEEAFAQEAHDRQLSRRDRAFEYGDEAHLPLRHFNRHDRQDRVQAKDERRVRAMLRPRTGDVDSSPRDVPVDEAA